ncbi:alpha-box mating type protein [Nannizzia gypsea CBS 118893]|uniref:Alpha-box mating type protein n=2 Tax=Arthroderma gypseum TaxID=63402 RepID=E4UWC8_ARTGP|nr:alpha-box mating type protein [Nannizzia gypsea CBS 118893]ACS91126.1 alpha box protein [Nannizzia gypsea]ACS91137.1 alpha box protein [Nannizzia gypsea]EFR02523.1 alpha-box mating type protein [Nannizzia gypsea CBS 118893]
MSGTEVSAVHRAFSNLLTTLTPEQVQKFMEEVNASTVATARVPASDSTQDREVSPSKASSTAMTTPEPTETITRPASRKRPRENAKLRPLNSFIAFRSFYSAAFPDLSQKVKSGLLRLLWSSDPFKAKWAIVAKAYSVIRDKHIGQVTLESFLALIGPFIGLVSVASYLDTMGLQVVSTENKQFSLIKSNPNAHINPMDLTTNLSVDDVVHYCYQIGYVAGIHLDSASQNQGAAVSMAVSAQSTPKSPATKANSTKRFSFSGKNATSQVGEHVTASDTNSSKENGNSKGLQVNTSVAPTNGNLTPAIPVNNPTTPPAAPSNNARNSGTYSQADFEGDLRRAMNNFPFGNNDGYYDLFNPGNRTRVYNPYCTQFDNFDINDYVDM